MKAIACFFLFLAALLLCASGVKERDFSNVLLSEQSLRDGARLKYKDSNMALVMQKDCDLVLQDATGAAIAHTDTSNKGFRHCSLSFNENGHLQIQTPDHLQVLWQSPNTRSKFGKYAAVLRPDGQVSIFGPVIWSIRQPRLEVNHPGTEDTLKAENVLFSGEFLLEGDKLRDHDKIFQLTDCELILRGEEGNVKWKTDTKANGQFCFASLSHRGELQIRDDNYASIWSSQQLGENDGDYALIMQHDGRVAIYGPEAYSTAQPDNGFFPILTTTRMK